MSTKLKHCRTLRKQNKTPKHFTYFKKRNDRKHCINVLVCKT